MRNNKLINDFIVYISNFTNKKGNTYYIQVDTDIWWKPRIIKDENSIIVGWLFLSLVHIKFSKENDNKKEEN